MRHQWNQGLSISHDVNQWHERLISPGNSVQDQTLARRQGPANMNLHNSEAQMIAPWNSESAQSHTFAQRQGPTNMNRHPSEARNPRGTTPIIRHPLINSNYHGDARRQSANIPEEKNCATWWTNLPSNCDVKMITDSLRNVGAISHLHINPPGGRHATAAAKVEFMSREGVDKLLAKFRNGEIIIAGHIPGIVLNRIRVPEVRCEVPKNQGNGGRGSRVLVVTGSQEIIRLDCLERLLRSQSVKYALESAIVTVLDDGRRSIEFRFASYVVQAVRARTIFIAQKKREDLSAQEKALWESVKICYGPDPCQ